MNIYYCKDFCNNPTLINFTRSTHISLYLNHFVYCILYYELINHGNKLFKPHAVIQYAIMLMRQNNKLFNLIKIPNPKESVTVMKPKWLSKYLKGNTFNDSI